MNARDGFSFADSAASAASSRHTKGSSMKNYHHGCCWMLLPKTTTAPRPFEESVCCTSFVCVIVSMMQWHETPRPSLVFQLYHTTHHIVNLVEERGEGCHAVKAQRRRKYMNYPPTFCLH
eukprot:scaffold3947_cov179-Amphora_coffeaeformis.AAC.5